MTTNSQTTSEVVQSRLDEFKTLPLFLVRHLSIEALTIDTLTTVELATEPLTMETKDIDGETPIFVCVRRADVIGVMAFIMEGADTSVKDMYGGGLLHAALSNSTSEDEIARAKDVVRVLLDAGLDKYAVDQFGESPLSYALKMKNKEFAELLLA